MVARPVPFLSSSPWPLVVISLSAAVLVGTAMAVDPLAAVALLVGLCYVPLVLFNLPLGIALWIPLMFVDTVPLPLPVGAGAGLLILLAWLGTVRERRSAARHFIAGHRRLLGVLALLVVWVTVSAAWADDLEAVGDGLWRWWEVGLLFVIVATSISDVRRVRLVGGAIVLGAVLSIVVGLAEPVPDATATARLYGGSGDPNYSAAGYLVAIIVAAGLLGGTRRPEQRFLLVAAIAVLAAAIAATQSRGAMVGAAAATVAALVVYRGRRGQVLAVVGAVLSVVALYFALSPGAFERVTKVEDDEPRTELWLIAWRVAQDHPLHGVGLANFTSEAPGYVNQPGALRYVELIAGEDLVVHNVPLQVLAETGLVGLLLYAGLALACLRAAALAARRADADARTGLAALSRAVAVAIVAMLSASLFLSNVTDGRTWLLLSLGPTLLAIASRREWPRSTSTT